MRMTAEQVLTLEQLRAGRCPLHISKHNPNCSICLNLDFHRKQNSEEFSMAEKEIGKGGLQSEIMRWCDSQWPKWVYDFPRTDLKSTLPVGRHDATIWGPFPECYLVETKAKGKKRTIEQLAWGARLSALGWQARVVYSLKEFLDLVGGSSS